MQMTDFPRFCELIYRRVFSGMPKAKLILLKGKNYEKDFEINRNRNGVGADINGVQ